MFLVGAISFLLIIAGIIGAVLPFLPGLPISFIGLLLMAIYTKFTTVSVTALIVFGILVAATIVLDVFAPALAAKGHKASGFGTMGAIIGTVLGVIIFGPLGILIGPFLGAFVGELANTGATTDHALKVAYAAVIGMLLGTVFKMMVGLGMIIYFLIALI
jgi:uncharacterized protein YqgC (DUF456 family)